MHNSRKSIRLPPAKYLGTQSYFVTICCDHRYPHLADPLVAAGVVGTLQECSAKQDFQLHAFCAMPDHLHFLAEGIAPRSDLRNLTRIFKLRTSYEFRRSRKMPLWEMSYYDHILRSHDPIAAVACYIWNNPVRAQLCASPQDFPYSGSPTIPWMQHASGTSWTPPWKQPFVVANL
jgi:putative transposase